MSFLIAFKEDNKIHLLSNITVDDDGLELNLENESSDLIWISKEDPKLIIGNYGYRREANILKTTNLTNNENKDLTIEYLNNTIAKNIITTVIEKERHDVKNKIAPRSRTIVAKDDKAFLIDFNGALLEIDDYYVLGADRDLLYGIVGATEGLKELDRINKIIDGYKRATRKEVSSYSYINAKDMIKKIILK